MISIQKEDFNQQEEYERLRLSSQIGAVVSFTGLVRDFNQGQGVSGLALEHYPGMTEKALQSIIDRAKQRWSVVDYRVIHRIGELKVKDQIVYVGIASAHRGDAFAACEFIMDYLKTQAPFWKKEVMEDGQSRWVDARETDQQALNKWQE